MNKFCIATFGYGDKFDLSGRIVVICDIYTAASNFAYCLSQSVNRLYLSEPNEIYELKDVYPRSLVIGDNKGLPRELFYCFSYPEKIRKLEIRGRDIIYVSDDTVKLVRNSYRAGAKIIIFAAFVNLAAVREWLEGRPEEIVIITAGDSLTGCDIAPEDLVCARILAGLLYNRYIDWDREIRSIREIMNCSYKIGVAGIMSVLDRDIYNVVACCRKISTDGWEVIDSSTRSQ